MATRGSFAATRAWTVGVCLALVPAAAARAQSPDVHKAREKTAGAFLDDLVSGRYEAATESFDETMQKAAPAETLAQIWEGLQAQFGVFKSFGPYTHEDGPEYGIVYVETVFEHSSRRLKIVFDAEGRIAGFFHVPATSGNGGGYRLPSYDKPGSYLEKDVQFGAAPWTVKGKLTLPRTRALVPAVVLVHGSGPHDEDETIGPNKPFRDLAAGLSSNGIAVLRYQKRTFAHKLRLVLKKTITVREEVIDDALEAVKFLREQPGIDGSKVFVLGHSLGATLAPRIAWDDKKLAGAILLAGTPRNFYDVLEDQLSYIASLPGPGQEGNKQVYEETRAAIARVRAGEDADKIKILSVPASYWRELNGYAKRSLKRAKKLECRLFIAGGGRDYQVTKKDYAQYRKALRKREKVTFRWYEKFNHLFMAGEAKATPNDYAEAGHVDEELIRDLAAWINRG